MIKVLIFMFFNLFSTFISYGQKQGKITYTISSSNNPYVTKIIDMWFTNEMYLYEFRYEDPSKSRLFNTLKKSNQEFDSTKFVNDIFESRKRIQHPNFYGNIQNNIQTQRLLLENKPVCVIDTLPKIIWKLYPDTITINKIFCQKATCSVNNNHYVAWYSPNIPIPFAPQIFQGLPGILIKINNIESHSSIIMTDIEWPTKNIIDIKPCSGYPLMSKLEFTKKTNEINSDLKKIFNEKKINNIFQLLDKFNN